MALVALVECCEISRLQHKTSPRDEREDVTGLREDDVKVGAKGKERDEIMGVEERVMLSGEKAMRVKAED